VAYSGDGRRIVSGSNDTTVRVWNAAMGEQLPMSESHHQNVTSVAHNPDGPASVDRIGRDMTDAATAAQRLHDCAKFSEASHTATLTRRPESSRNAHCSTCCECVMM